MVFISFRLAVSSTWRTTHTFRDRSVFYFSLSEESSEILTFRMEWNPLAKADGNASRLVSRLAQQPARARRARQPTSRARRSIRVVWRGPAGGVVCGQQPDKPGSRAGGAGEHSVDVAETTLTCAGNGVGGRVKPSSQGQAKPSQAPGVRPCLVTRADGCSLGFFVAGDACRGQSASPSAAAGGPQGQASLAVARAGELHASITTYHYGSTRPGRFDLTCGGWVAYGFDK